MASKRKTVDRHFMIRCIQRLGYVPSTKSLIKQIQNNKLEFYYRESNRLSHWKWKDPIKNIDCILVYDKERKQLVTILFENSDTYLKNLKELYANEI